VDCFVVFAITVAVLQVRNTTAASPLALSLDQVPTRRPPRAGPHTPPPLSSLHPFDLRCVPPTLQSDRASSDPSLLNSMRTCACSGVSHTTLFSAASSAARVLRSSQVSLGTKANQTRKEKVPTSGRRRRTKGQLPTESTDTNSTQHTASSYGAPTTVLHCETKPDIFSRSSPPCPVRSMAAVCFRMQLDTKGDSKPANLEKVFADYCVACVFLFFVAISYVG